MVKALFLVGWSFFICVDGAVLASEPIRMMLTIGNDQGGQDDTTLRYASRDAERVGRVLTALSDVKRSWELINQNAQRVTAALAEITQAIGQERSIAKNRRVELLIFYSGHADEQSLHLSGTTLRLEEFRQQAQAAGADLTLLVLDACRNRLASVPKGMSLEDELDIAVEQQGPSGFILIRSVREGEIAVESDALEGSVFTHHWIASLEGAADLNGDGRILLSEAFSQTRAKTMLTSLQDLGRTQHPSYEMKLIGEEDVVLTEINRAGTQLIFSEDLTGHFYVVERFLGTTVSELRKDDQTTRALALPRGEYLVYTRSGDDVRVAKVSLVWNRENVLRSKDFESYSSSQVFTKGGRIQVRQFSVYAGLEVENGWIEGISFFPTVRLDGAYRLGRLELLGGLAFADTRFKSLDSRIDNVMVGVQAGLRLGFAQALGVWISQGEFRTMWLRQTSASDSRADVFVGQFRLSQQFRFTLSVRSGLSMGVGMSLNGFKQDQDPVIKLSAFGLLGYNLLF